MPTPRSQPGDPLTPRQAECWDAYQRLKSIRAVAAELGCAYAAAHDCITRARFKLSIPEGITYAADVAGLDLDTLAHGWVKAKGKDGEPDVSAFFRVPRPEDDPLERIRAAFEDLTPAPAVAPPQRFNADLLTLYPLADVHLGQLSWGRESGEDYDLAIAAQQLRQAMADLIVACPESDTAVILDAGDLFHAENDDARTPQSKHALDVDGRYFRTLELGVTLLADLVDGALKKHNRVLFWSIPGNHSPIGRIAVSVAMAQRYRNDPRVEVARDPSEFFVYAWGRCLLAAHHGDKAPPERLGQWLAEHDLWQPRQFRHFFLGHHHKDMAGDIGGIRFERLRAFTAKDAYAAANAYVTRRSLQAITFHRERGEIARVKRHI
jgi:hypothetical protein